MFQVLNTLYVIAAVIFLFGAAIFVHEFGHYWVARRRGLKVEAFAIGFGPRLFSWTRDGIEYSIRCIPAGGFVKLPQMITSEALEGSAQEKEKLEPVSPLSKILVAFAGPLMNVVFAFAIATVIYFVGLPIAVNPSIIGYVDPESPEYALGIREGDRVVSVDGKLVRSWQDVQMTTILARTNVLPVVIERDGAEKTYELTAQVHRDLGLKVLRLDPKEHPVIAQVTPGSVAEGAGLEVGDRFVSFAGVPIVGHEQLVTLIRQRTEQPTEAEIQRGQERIALTVTPAADPVTREGRLGVALGVGGPTVYQVQRPGPTPWEQVTNVFDLMARTIGALVYSKQTGVGAKDLSGPVGILAMLAAWVNTDYRLALSFLVLLNVNLAVLNLLPVPVLDGGHIMMSIVEKIRRRPMSVRFVEVTTTAFALLLISFMLYVTFFDLKRWSLFRSMFDRETQIEEVQGTRLEAPPADPAP
jgi:regulator of sigma E protease